MSIETAQSTSVMVTATEADYRRDPTRWGSAEMAAYFPGFKHLDMGTSGAVIRLRHGGSGPPLLLVHGNPENHTCWYKVAARLAENFSLKFEQTADSETAYLPRPVKTLPEERELESQKQTFRQGRSMAALPPKADIVSANGTSALYQKQTLAISFDQLVGERH